MSGVAEHYERMLSPVYAWMTGGTEAAFAAGKSEIEALNLPLADGSLVVDLGAGFGMHAIPLATAGCRVIAVDSSSYLLGQLNRLAGTLPITTVQGDLLSFRASVGE